MDDFYYEKAFRRFPAFPGFHFLPQSIFENTETTENHDNLVFLIIKTIYVICSTFLRVLYVQGTIFKVLIKARTLLNVLAQSYQRKTSNEA